jgi:hypothetical protein
MANSSSLDEIFDGRFATENESVWPTTLLGNILAGRQKNARLRMGGSNSRVSRELWSAVIIEYSYAIAADRAGNDEHCKKYSQRAILLEDEALTWDAEHGL